MAYLLTGRSALSDAKDTLSSWDKCMAKTYCKWPVIVAIIVGSLIVLSVVLCVARCICCGAELACCCFKCCTCCCPSGGRGRKHKRVDSKGAPPPTYPPYQPAPPLDSRPVNQQYRSHAAPTFNPAPAPNYNRAAEPDRPQFATFETPSKPVNEDALPAMPSWADAKSTHVEETVMPEKQGDVEMDRLDQNGSVTGSAGTAAAIAGGPGRPPARSPVHRSNTQDSYGFPPGYQNDSYAGAVPGPRRSPGPKMGPRGSPGPNMGPRNSPGPNGRYYGEQPGDYRDVSPVQSLSPVYGASGGYGQNQQYGRRSPNPPTNTGYNQQYGPPAPGRSPTSPVANQNAYDYSNNSASAAGYGQQYERPYQGRSPASPVQNQDTHNRSYNSTPAPRMPQSNSYGPAPSARSPSPGYAPSGSTRYEPSVAAYPGQQTYEAPASAYPGQQSYQPYQTTQESQYTGVTRKAVEGSWKDV